VVRSSARK